MAPTPPTAADLVASPAAIGVDQAFTVKAKIGNAKDTRWTLKVTGTDCNFDHTIDETAVPDNQQQSGDLSIRVDPLDWTCLGEYTIQLDLTGPGGSAPPIQTPIKLVTDSVHKALHRKRDLHATESEVVGFGELQCDRNGRGMRGSWTWSVVNADTEAAVVEPVEQQFKVPFIPTLPSAGHYTVQLVVNFRGESDVDTVDVRSTVTVPSIVGMSAANAKSELDAAGLSSSSVATASHQNKDQVIAQSVAASTSLPLRRSCADNSFQRPQCPRRPHRVGTNGLLVHRRRVTGLEWQ